MQSSEIKIGNSGVKNKPFRVEEGGYLTLSNGDKMYIPADYVFDNGSIPSILKFLYDTFNIGFLNYKQKSFLVHDYLYNFRGYRKTKRYLHTPIDRSSADNEMRYYMIKNGDSKFKVYTYYLAVRLFGWIHWGKI